MQSYGAIVDADLGTAAHGDAAGAPSAAGDAGRRCGRLGRSLGPRASGRRPGHRCRPRRTGLGLALLFAVALAGPRLQAQRYSWTNFAGQPGAPGVANGRGSTARFRNPIGVAVDDVGNVYVADSGNYTIRLVNAAGVVTTLAGSPGNPGSANGSGIGAQFRWPTGVAADSAGAVYVADTDLRTIRRVTAGGVVTTLAGNTGNIGSADGSGSAARFNNPLGIARGSSGTIYVADTYNRTIRAVTAAGAVTTLAGLAGNLGSADGTGSAARFYDPLGVAVNSAGTVYVADAYNHTLRQITPAGVVTTLAGVAGSVGSADGLGSAARFSLPFGVAVDRDGSLYVTDARNYTVRKVTAAGQVTTIGGTAGLRGSADGTGSAASFASPYGIAVDRAGIIYVADAANHRISRGTPLLSATVTGVTSPEGDGLWGIGSRIAIVVTFNQPVMVTGVPQLALETGATDALANYASGSGTTMLTFLYTVAAGQETPDLDCLGTTALTLHGGTIRDAAGSSAALTLPVPGAATSLGANQAIAVDGIAPTVVLTSTATEPTKVTPLPVLVAFSKPVTGFTIDDLNVTNGTADALAGTGATYSLAVTPAGQGRVTVGLAAGACVSAAGNPNSAAVPISRTFDSVSPFVVDVSSPTPDGTYGPGAAIQIRLTFSETVVVSGTPQLALETGETDALANVNGGSGTATLTCTYGVVAGQTSADLDYVGTEALMLSGALVEDAAGNDAVLTLPAPGAAHSLGANQALVVAAIGAPNGPFLARLGAAEVASGRGLWDLSGSYAIGVGGNDLTLALVHDIQGRLTGTATLQFGPGKALQPLALQARGGVRGSAGTLLASLRLQGTDTAGARRAALALNLALNVATRQLSGPLTGTLEADGVPTPVSATATLALPPPMDGTWSLFFELQQGAKSREGSATLSLSNGVQYHLTVRGKAGGSRAVLHLTGMPSDPAAAGLGIRTAIETLAGELTALQVFSGKAYGQSLAW